VRCLIQDESVVTPRKTSSKKRPATAKKAKKKAAAPKRDLEAVLAETQLALAQAEPKRDLETALAEAQRALAQAERSNVIMSQIIKDLLSFARLEAGRVAYDIQPVSVFDVVKSVVEITAARTAEAGLTCTMSVDESFIVAADLDKFQQILLNLLSNAIKFTPRGGKVSLDVPVRPALPDDAIFLRVADTGCGIPRSKQELIFEPFIQAHRPVSRGTIGMGLGLAIGRDLARGMGGDLRVRSDPGKGSSFTLTLRRFPESDL
jgi:signal transduction histidine kinase